MADALSPGMTDTIKLELSADHARLLLGILRHALDNADQAAPDPYNSEGQVRWLCRYIDSKFPGGSDR